MALFAPKSAFSKGSENCVFASESKVGCIYCVILGVFNYQIVSHIRIFADKPAGIRA